MNKTDDNDADYVSHEGIASFWTKDGAWHIALPCPDPDPVTKLKTGGFRWTADQYESKADAMAAIKDMQALLKS